MDPAHVHMPTRTACTDKHQSSCYQPPPYALHTCTHQNVVTHLELCMRSTTCLWQHALLTGAP